MTIDISAIARAVRKQAAADDISIKLGHAHELIAACLGYTSLSALQTAQAVGSELRNFHKARHVVIDLDLARRRAQALGHSALAGPLHELLSVAFSARNKWTEVHTDFRIFEEALKRIVGQQMLADPDVLASIGGAHMEDRFNICIDDSLMAEEVPVCERVNVTWTGRVTPKEGAHIPGSTLLVVAAVSARRVGERCFEGPFVEVCRLAVA